MLLGAMLQRRLMKLENRSPAIAALPRRTPTLQSMRKSAAPVAVASTAKITPRLGRAEQPLFIRVRVDRIGKPAPENFLGNERGCRWPTSAGSAHPGSCLVASAIGNPTDARTANYCSVAVSPDSGCEIDQRASCSLSRPPRRWRCKAIPR